MMSGSATRIMGIDPGTRHVGFGIIETSGSAFRCLAAGVINAGDSEIAKRLTQIHIALQDKIRQYAPAVAVVETVYGGENLRTALAIGEGRGVAIISAAELGVAVVGLEPAVVKRAVAGSGRASKEQVQRMVRILLGLAAMPATDHEADALALAIAYANRQRYGLGAIPQRIARRKRHWPVARKIS